MADNRWHSIHSRLKLSRRRRGWRRECIIWNNWHFNRFEILMVNANQLTTSQTNHQSWHLWMLASNARNLHRTILSRLVYGFREVSGRFHRHSSSPRIKVAFLVGKIQVPAHSMDCTTVAAGYSPLWRLLIANSPRYHFVNWTAVFPVHRNRRISVSLEKNDEKIIRSVGTNWYESFARTE